MSSKTISESYSQGSDVVATSAYVGEGGLQEVYLGAGWMPCRYVSVGANIGFVWGSINHSSAITYSDASVTSSLRSYQSSPALTSWTSAFKATSPGRGQPPRGRCKLLAGT